MLMFTFALFSIACLAVQSPEFYVQETPPICQEGSGRVSPSWEDSGKGALLGLAVGDAVGVALEFSPRVIRPSDVVLDMVGNPGLYGGMRVGEWTDDTSMALAMGESFLNCQGFSGNDMLSKWLAWKKVGYFNPKNERAELKEWQRFQPAFDVGNTTAQALSWFGSGVSKPGVALNDLGRSPPSNGSIMRLAPVALYAYGTNQGSAKALEWAKEQSELTHGHPAAIDSSRILAYLLIEAMNGASKEALLRGQGFDFSTFHSNPVSQRIREFFENGISKTRSMLKPTYPDSSGGSAEFTLKCVLWAFARSSTFEDAILLAINLGRDADTVGAIIGQLAGAYYGFSSIPKQWVSKLVQTKQIQEMADALLSPPGTSLSIFVQRSSLPPK